MLRGETGESWNRGIVESWNRGIVESWNRKTKKVYLIFFAVSLGILRQNPQKNGSFLPIGAGPRGKQDDVAPGNKTERRGLLLCKTPDCMRRPSDYIINRHLACPYGESYGVFPYAEGSTGLIAKLHSKKSA